MKEASPRQHQVLRFIYDFHKKHGQPPVFREIMTYTGFALPTIRDIVNCLVKKEYLTKFKGQTRGLRLTDKGRDKGSE